MNTCVCRETAPPERKTRWKSNPDGNKKLNSEDTLGFQIFPLLPACPYTVRLECPSPRLKYARQPLFSRTAQLAEVASIGKRGPLYQQKSGTPFLGVASSSPSEVVRCKLLKHMLAKIHMTSLLAFQFTDISNFCLSFQKSA